MRPARTTILHFLTRLGVSVIGFVGTVFLTNVLNADVYGTYIVVISLLSWFTIPTTAVHTAIRKRVSESDEKGEFLSAGFVFGGTILVVLVLFVILVRGHLRNYIGEPVIPLFIFILIGFVSLGAMTAGLDGQRKVEYSGLLRLVEQTLRLGFQVGLLVLGLQLVGALIGYGLSFLLVAFLGLFFYEAWPTIPQKKHFTEIFSYAKYSWMGGMKSNVTGPVIDVIILNLFVANSSIGIYQAAWNLASILVMVSGSVQSALFPEVSMHAAENEYERVRDLLEESLIVTGVFAIPGIFGAVIVGSKVLRIYGPEFARGGDILIILIIARIVSAFSSQLVNIINGINRPDLSFRINVLLITTNVGLNLILIPFIEWYGAAIATAISTLVALSLGYYYLRDLIGRFPLPLREIGNQVGASLIMVGVLLIVIRNFPIVDTVSTISVVFFGGGVYFFAILVLSEYFRSKFRSVLSVG